MRSQSRLAIALRNVFTNRELRRVQLAFAGGRIATLGTWLALLVYAFGQGGATEAGLVAFLVHIPGIIFAPFVAVLSDRYPPNLDH